MVIMRRSDRPIYRRAEYIIINKYIVVNIKKEFRDGHTHQSNFAVAKRVISCAINKKIPVNCNEYFLQSLIRVSRDKEFIGRVNDAIARRGGLMRVVEVVRIGGMNYRVDVTPEVPRGDDGAELAGAIDFEHGNISILATAHRQLQERTLLHEAIHGIDEYMDIGLEEEQVNRLANGLYALIIDNPALFGDEVKQDPWNELQVAVKGLKQMKEVVTNAITNNWDRRNKVDSRST